MVKLSVEKDVYKLSGFGSIRLKGTSETEIVGAIKELVKQMKLTSRNVAISVSGSQVIVRFITIPRMKGIL